MFIFDTEERPHASAADFREAYEEAKEGGVLQFASIDGVENPIEAEDGVENHGKVVYPRAVVAEDVPKEGMFGVRIAQT